MSAGESESQRWIGTVLGGRYRVDDLLGHGGMGTVYRGVQLSVDRPVAIKLFAPEMRHTPDLIKRFEREAQLLSRLSHPQIVSLYDYGVADDGQPYFVMELLRGADLAQTLASEGPMRVERALGITLQTLKALRHAHGMGVVHRDLKPHNLFLLPMDGEELVKVMDFGIARIIDDRSRSAITMTGEVLGTALYMAPEQAEGKSVDARADLYALGIILFEMLTGRCPFEADSIVTLLLLHASKQPPRLLEVAPGLDAPPELQALLDRLLAKSPDDRPASAEQAAELVLAIADRASLGIARGTLAHAPTALVSSAASVPAAMTAGAEPVAAGLRAGPVGSTVGRLLGTRRSAGLALAALTALAVLIGIALFTGDTAPPAASADDPHVVLPAEPAPEPAPELPVATAAPEPARPVGQHAAPVDKPSARPADDAIPEGTTAVPAATPRPSKAPARQRDTPPRTVQPSPATERAARPAQPATHAPAASPAPARSTPVPLAPAAARTAPAPAPAPASRPQSGVGRVVGSVTRGIEDILGIEDRRERRYALLARGPTYPNVAATKAAYKAGRIDRQHYEDTIWVLKMQHKQRVQQAKADYRAGRLDKVQYKERIRAIDRAYEGP